MYRVAAATTLGLLCHRRAVRAHADTISPPTNYADVAVIGGGVVGLAVARFCAVAGYKVCVLERQDTIAAEASSGNSGIGCTVWCRLLGMDVDYVDPRVGCQVKFNEFISVGLLAGLVISSTHPEQVSVAQF
jgi:hypothetical protein